MGGRTRVRTREEADQDKNEGGETRRGEGGREGRKMDVTEGLEIIT